MSNVRIDKRKLYKFRSLIHSGQGLKLCFKKWGVRYLTWTKRLYKKNAAGGGEWPALKSVSYRRAMGTNLMTTKGGRKRSKARRAKMKQKLKAAISKVKILIDTSTLYNALSIGNAGNLFRFLLGFKKGVRVGFADIRKHKGTHKTIQEIAKIHQTGDPKINLPQRKIFHIPDATLKTSMLNDLSKDLNKLGHSL